MDETTKVIIATISGFIIAFLAEPVKDIIQHRTKLLNLKVALYKELWSNYATLDVASRHEVPLTMFFYQPSLRTECYKHALEHEISLFYQLEEATMMNSLQGDAIRRIIDFSDYVKSLPHEEFRERNSSLTEQFKSLAGIFLNLFTMAAQERVFDAKLLKKITRGSYEEVRSRKH